VRANPSSIVPATNETVDTGDRAKDSSAKNSSAKNDKGTKVKKTQKPQKTNDTPKTPIEQREATQPPIH
jgi:hypothetical protein